MAIAKLKPDAVPAIVTTMPEAIPEPNKSIFTSLIPESKITSLLKHIEGYPWTVDFYGQILNTNNTVENYDPTTPNLTQPYYKVSKLVLQVDSPLTSSYDQGTGITTIQGSALTPYKITPNFGDVFIAQVDSGEDAIFHITSVSRKTHRKNTLYEISYNLYAYTSVQPEFITKLEQKVNDTYYYDSNIQFTNQEPLIRPSAKEAADRLQRFLVESQAYYFSVFAQKKYGSILIPGVDERVYDPLLLEFLSKIIDYSQLVESPFHRFTYFNKYIDQNSFFTILMQRSPALIPTINKTFSFIDSSLLDNKARFGTAFHAGVDYILYPTNPNTSSDIGVTTPIDNPDFISTIITSKNDNDTTPILIQTTNNNQITSKPLLHDLFKDDYYLVTENFYKYLQDNTFYNDISYTEFLLAKFIRKEAIAREDLAIAVEKYATWPLLKQLYLLPLYWLLVANT